MTRLELVIHLHVYGGEPLFNIFRLLSKLKEAEALDYTVTSIEYVGD